VPLTTGTLWRVSYAMWRFIHHIGQFSLPETDDANKAHPVVAHQDQMRCATTPKRRLCILAVNNRI